MAWVPRLTVPSSPVASDPHCRAVEPSCEAGRKDQLRAPGVAGLSLQPTTPHPHSLQTLWEVLLLLAPPVPRRKTRKTVHTKVREITPRSIQEYGEENTG